MTKPPCKSTCSATFDSDAFLRRVRSKNGHFFRLNLTRKSGSKASYVAKFRKATPRSVVLLNTTTQSDVVIPFSTVSSICIG